MTRKMTDSEIEEMDEARKLSYVLPQISDLETEPALRTNTIQGAIENLLGVGDFGHREEEIFDVALGVRVSKKTSARIDYFSQRFGMTKAIFLRQLLNERLSDISHQMYANGLLDEITTLLAQHHLEDPINEADHVMARQGRG